MPIPGESGNPDNDPRPQRSRSLPAQDAQNKHHKLWGPLEVEVSSNSFSEARSETKSENSSNPSSAVNEHTRTGVVAGPGSSRRKLNVKRLSKFGVDLDDVQLLNQSSSSAQQSKSETSSFDSNLEGGAETATQAAPSAGHKAAGPPGVWRTDDAPNLYDPSLEQMSPGSLRHADGTCKPCAWYWTRGCSNGRGCSFCHLCEDGTIKLRRKERLWRLAAERRSANQGRGSESSNAADSSRAPGKPEAAFRSTKTRL